MSFRFSKTKRLRKTSDIRKVFASKQKVRAEGFVLKWIPAQPGSESRVCVSVRKKEIPTAVARNRMRRLVKEFFRRHASSFKKPVDLVVQVLEYKTVKYEELEKLLTSQLKHSGVIG